MSKRRAAVSGSDQIKKEFKSLSTQDKLQKIAKEVINSDKTTIKTIIEQVVVKDKKIDADQLLNVIVDVKKESLKFDAPSQKIIENNIKKLIKYADEEFITIKYDAKKVDQMVQDKIKIEKQQAAKLIEAQKLAKVY